MPLNISQFGSGSVFINPNGGNLASNPTPFKIGILQDYSLDFKGENVPLWGQNRLPDIVAPSEINMSVKVNFASLQGIPLTQAFLVGSVASGIKQVVDDEPHTVPSSTAYTITLTNIPVLIDFGVRYQATGRNLTKVSGSPTQGQYAVNLTTGVYTFAAADASAPVYISYTYAVTGTGQTFGYQNQKQGVGPSCQIVLYEPFSNALRGWLLNNCLCKSIGHPTKQKGFVIQAAEFDIFDNPGGNAWEYYDYS